MNFLQEISAVKFGAKYSCRLSSIQETDFEQDQVRSICEPRKFDVSLENNVLDLNGLTYQVLTVFNPLRKLGKLS